MTTIARITAARDATPRERRERRRERLMQPLATLRAETTATLKVLTGEVRLVAELIDSHQRGLGFLTAEAKEARHQQQLADADANRERYAIAERLLMDVPPSGHGATAAPGNVAAISADDHISRTTRKLVNTLEKQLRTRHGLCVIGTLPDAADTTLVVERLARTVALVRDRRTVVDTLEVVEELVLDANAVVEGADRSRLAGVRCPNCDLETLTIVWREWIIRCDKAPHAQHAAPCVCSDPLCPCKLDPVAHRHVWTLASGPSRSDSWHSLARRIGVKEARAYIDQARRDVEGRKKRLARLTKRTLSGADRAVVRPPATAAAPANTSAPHPFGRPHSEADRCDETDLPVAFCSCTEHTTLRKAQTP